MAFGFIFCCSICGLSTNGSLHYLTTWGSWTMMHQSIMFLPEWMLSSVLTANTSTTVCSLRSWCLLVHPYINLPSWFLTVQIKVSQPDQSNSILRLPVAKFCFLWSSFMTLVFSLVYLCVTQTWSILLKFCVISNLVNYMGQHFIITMMLGNYIFNYFATKFIFFNFQRYLKITLSYSKQQDFIMFISLVCCNFKFK